MEIIRLVQPGLFERSFSQEIPRPLPGEALVKVHAVGICGTDLHAYKGRQPFLTYPRILGHELGVEIVEIQGASELRKGDRCAVAPYLHCGTCEACRRGKTNCCTQLQVLGVHRDGGMQEYICLPVYTLHPSQVLDYKSLALVETLCIGKHAVERAEPQPQDTVLLLGAGPIGLAILESLAPYLEQVWVSDLNQDRLDFCTNKYPIKGVLPAGEGFVDRLKENLSGELATLVIDATGNPQSMQANFHYAAHGGRIVWVGLFQGDATFPDPLFHKKELTLLSSRNARPDNFKEIIAYLEKGQIKVETWISHTSTSETFIEDFPSFLDPANKIIKPVLQY